MQYDLFDTDPDPDYQDEYRESLQKSWNETLRIIRDRHEVPPWTEADNLLDQDELRLLKYVDASGSGYVEGERCVVDHGEGRIRNVPVICRDTGFKAEANYNAVLNRCLAKEYLSRITHGVEARLLIGIEGRWRLDAIEADEYWSTETP